MRYFIVVGICAFFGTSVFPLGGLAPLPAKTEPMSNTVGKLNQVTQEKKPGPEQQDLQEKQFHEDQLREKKEWEEQKAIEDADLESINNPK